MKKILIVLFALGFSACGEEDTYCFTCRAIILNEQNEQLSESNEEYCGWTLDQAKSYVGTESPIDDGRRKWIQSCRGAAPWFLIDTNEVR